MVSSFEQMHVNKSVKQTVDLCNIYFCTYALNLYKPNCSLFSVAYLSDNSLIPSGSSLCLIF